MSVHKCDMNSFYNALEPVTMQKLYTTMIPVTTNKLHFNALVRVREKEESQGRGSA